MFFRIALAGLSLLLGVLFSRSKRRHAGLRLPPSPPDSLPILGHLLAFLRRAQDLHEWLRALSRKHGDSEGFLFLRLGAIDTLVVSAPAAAREVLKTHDVIFASRPIATAGQFFGYNSTSLTFAPYGEHFKKFRRLSTQEIFSAARVEMFQPVRELEIRALVADLSAARRPASIIAKLTDLTFNIMLRTLVSKSYSSSNSDPGMRQQARRFKETIHEAFAVASDTGIGDFLPVLKIVDTTVPRIKALQDKLDAMLQAEVDEHRASWSSGQAPRDFVDVMLSVPDMSDNEDFVKSLLLDVLAAGTDSIAITVEWCMAELIHNDKLRAVQAEIDAAIGSARKVQESDIPHLYLLQAVIKETFRLHPPVPIYNHESTHDCNVGTANYFIPAKTRLMINAHALGRDPMAWPEPDKFDPSRFLGPDPMDVRGQHFELIPFGSGRRSCPALNMGLLTVQIALATLLHAFNWQLPKGEELDMAAAFGSTLPKAKPLLLVPSMRESAHVYLELFKNEA